MGYYNIIPKKSSTLHGTKKKIHINSIVTLVSFLVQLYNKNYFISAKYLFSLSNRPLDTLILIHNNCLFDIINIMLLT